MKKAFIWCDNASKTNFISTILKEPDRISFRDYVVKYKPKLSIVHSESHFENIRFDEHNNELQIQSNDIPVGVALFADFSDNEEYADQAYDIDIFLLSWPYKSSDKIHQIRNICRKNLNENKIKNISYKVIFFYDLYHKTSSTDLENIDVSLQNAANLICQEIADPVVEKLLEFSVYQNKKNFMDLFVGKGKILTAFDIISFQTYYKWKNENFDEFKNDYDLEMIVCEDDFLDAQNLNQITCFSSVQGSKNVIQTYVDNYYRKFFEKFLNIVKELYIHCIEPICFWNLDADLKILQNQIIKLYTNEFADYCKQFPSIIACPYSEREYQEVIKNQYKYDIKFYGKISDFLKNTIVDFVFDYLNRKEKILKNLIDLKYK